METQKLGVRELKALEASSWPMSEESGEELICTCG